MRTCRRLVPLPMLLLLALPAESAAQFPRARPAPRVGADSVLIAADSSHAAGAMFKVFFGRHYRDLWTAPIRVAVLDLARFDGGLEATEEGGGKQTANLHFDSKNGREWVFRSVDKDARAILPEKLRESFLVGVVNDQTSHAHPGGALMVPPLATALGVLHPAPQLAVMPDDPALGKFREKFAGMLGQLEVLPKDGPDGAPGFAGATKVLKDEEFLPALIEDPSVRIDAEAFLTARLLDFLINDWDRHKGNWRWARLERGGRDRWVPIPRDRDQAFLWFDGLLPSLGRMVAPQLLLLTPEIQLKGLTINGAELDNTLLAELDRAAWDSVTQSVVRRLTDSVIDAAEATLPPAYRTLRPGEMSALLRLRRDALPAAAAAFYEKLSSVVDVHGTDQREVAVVTTAEDGAVELRLFDGREGKTAREPYFQRRFVPAETRELRVYLHGGDDSLAATGPASGRILVRVIGGKDDNVSGDMPEGIRLYDFGPGPHDLTYGADTLFERRPQIVHGSDTLVPPRDHGKGMSPSVRLRYRSDLGLVSGFGVELERYGFRRYPYARRTSLSLQYATGPGDARFDLGVDLRREGGGPHPIFRAFASGLELMRWYGLGNETARPGDGTFNLAEHTQYGAELMIGQDLGGHGFAEVGPAVLLARTDVGQDRFIGLEAPYGTGDFGQLGARARFRLGRGGGDEAVDLQLDAGGSAFPAIWDVATAFGEVHGTGAAHLSAGIPFSPVLALRAGGRRVFGDFPFFESAFLGGIRNLRGFDEQRFAGEAMAFGNAELRLSLLPMTLMVPGRLGVLGLADVGRVWVDGEESDTWHRAFGGGIWFGVDPRHMLLSVTLADSPERTGVYVEAGFAF